LKTKNIKVGALFFPSLFSVKSFGGIKLFQSFLLVFFLSVLAFSCKNKNNELPFLHIITENEIGWDKKEGCMVDYISGKDSLRFIGKIHCRGGNSSRYGKHSFALKSDVGISIAGLPKEKEWVLNASFIDKTFMRHKINYDLFMEMNPQNIAPATRYVNVKINNEYYGFYLLKERLSAGSLGLKKKDSLAMIFKEPPVFHHIKPTAVQDSLNYYQQKFPKKIKSDKSYYLEQFRNFLTESSDEKFSSEINQWIELKNIIDWHLLLLFSNNDDGVVKNFYLYKTDSKTPFRVAIWDYDHSFGRDGDNELNLMERNVRLDESILFSRLMESSSHYKKQLKDRWFGLRENDVFTLKNINRHIQRNNLIVEKELLKNHQRWQHEDFWYADQNDYKKEIKLIQDFVKMRIKHLDEYFKEF
jgi:hypothetical protein